MAAVRCPSCAATNAQTQRFCGACGATLPRPDAETMTSPAPPAGTPAPPRIASDGARFLPGQVLAERYRMVGLLGKGGMGEVYRADDLKLGQPVALKFLPRDVESDPERLDRFLTEVRLSLRVTHPNVCRVFDIGAGGWPPFSVDGVRGRRGSRVAAAPHRAAAGRQSRGDRAAALRGTCGRARRRRAASRSQAGQRDARRPRPREDHRLRPGGRHRRHQRTSRRAPARRSTWRPNSSTGASSPIQTDLYSLGLVLYELFTGKRAFEAANSNELASMRSSTPTSPSAHVAGLNPVVERAILRCSTPIPRSVRDPQHRWRRRCPAAIRWRWRLRPAKRRRRKWSRGPAGAANFAWALPPDAWP